MNVSELTGEKLDIWVGRACGYKFDEDGDNRTIRDNGGAPSKWHPSVDWAQGGPLIEDKGICVIRTGLENPLHSWVANFEKWDDRRTQGMPGPTALVAAMRALVEGRYGNTVPDE
jgi:hypothetical protein